MISVGVWLSLARAPGLGPGGRRFESCHPDFFIATSCARRHMSLKNRLIFLWNLYNIDICFVEYIQDWRGIIMVKQFAYQVSYLKYTVIETMYHVIYDLFISRQT